MAGEKKGMSSKNSSNSDTSMNNKTLPKSTSTSVPDTSENRPSNLSVLLGYFPPWVRTNLTKPRSLKTLFRCWLASWVGFIILLPNASLNTLGTAGFFALLCSFFLPPNLPVQMFLFMLITLVAGLCFSWGVGVAAMRAANTVRSVALLMAAEARLQESIENTPSFQANPSLAQTTAIFTGEFLDIRASAVYGCFLGVFTFIYALMRAYSPKLAFTSIFATIGIDIFCTFGPLIPTADYTLLKSFIISIACYAAIALITTFCVFPETMSHSALRTVCEQLERVEKAVGMQTEVFGVVRTGEDGLAQLASGKALPAKLDGLKALMVGVMRQTFATTGLISLEFSYGKWNSDDVKDVIPPLGTIVARSVALQSFSKLIGRMQISDEDTTSSDDAPADLISTANSTSTKLAASSNDAYLLHQITSLNHRFEAAHNVRIIDIIPFLESASLELRDAIISAVAAMRKSLEDVNRHRWTRSPVDGSLSVELDEAYEQLRNAVINFTKEGQDSKRMQILAPFLSLLQDPEGSMTKEEQAALPFRSLFFAFVLGTNLVSLSEGIMTMMDTVKATLAKRKKNRLWAPKGLRKLGNFAKGRGLNGEDEDGATALGENPVQAKEEDEEQGLTSHKLDPDSRPPTNVLQKIMNRVHMLYKWCYTPEAVFAFKYMFVSIAIWLPAVVNRTAAFYYKEKGLWALIMAQTTLNIYAADQVFNLVVRILGTFVGAIVGLVAWYMGNGHGIGNPYGAAAAVGVCLPPLLFLRNFAPPQFLPGIILCCATFALVVGYSWVDGHIAQFATPGIGWSIAWKRFTLVIIGATAAFIMMMLPPTSGRKAVRMRNASTIANLANLYAFLMSTWIAGNIQPDSDSDSSANDDDESGEAPLNVAEKPATNSEAGVTVPRTVPQSTSASGLRPAPTPSWLNEFRIRLLSISEETTALRQLTGMATWEGSIRGKWPAEEYNALLNVESEMLIGLAQLGNALAHLDDDWRVEFMHNTRVLNPNFITDVMTVFSLISQSLRTAEPLHQVLPQSLVGRLMYHHYNLHHLHKASPVMPSSSSRRSKEELSVETISSLDYMYYATGVVAVFLVLRSVDELQRITKRLCGEVPFKGFANWRNQFEHDRAAHV